MKMKYGLYQIRVTRPRIHSMYSRRRRRVGVYLSLKPSLSPSPVHRLWRQPRSFLRVKTLPLHSSKIKDIRPSLLLGYVRLTTLITLLMVSRIIPLQLLSIGHHRHIIVGKMGLVMDI